MSGKVSVSIVLYRHAVEEVADLFKSLANDPEVSDWVIIDNGGSEESCRLAESLGARCIVPGFNLGFGAAHNRALRSHGTPSPPYHLILNPDIQLRPSSLPELVAVMDSAPQVGLLMPRILYPDGSIQYLCKLLPTPLDLFLRRFAFGPWRSLFENRMSRYDMKSFDYSIPAYVPVLSGCFMFTRRAVLEAVRGFDERFFLYMEDIDLCRRIGEVSRLLFWPGTSVAHRHAQGSYRQPRLLWLHVRSAVTYFNKWGWYSDPFRRRRNKEGLIPANIDCWHEPEEAARNR